MPDEPLTVSWFGSNGDDDPVGTARLRWALQTKIVAGEHLKHVHVSVFETLDEDARVRRALIEPGNVRLMDDRCVRLSWWFHRILFARCTALLGEQSIDATDHLGLEIGPNFHWIFAFGHRIDELLFKHGEIDDDLIDADLLLAVLIGIIERVAASRTRVVHAVGSERRRDLRMPSIYTDAVNEIVVSEASIAHLSVSRAA